MSNVVKLAEAKEVVIPIHLRCLLRPNSQIQMEIQIWETCQDRTLKQKLGL